MMAGASAGITQLQNVPPEWGQGAEGYARRFANYYAYATTRSLLQMAGEDILHEDNLYYGSGERGMRRQVVYAVKSSVLARGNDGTQHLSISRSGSTAGAAFYLPALAAAKQRFGRRRSGQLRNFDGNQRRRERDSRVPAGCCAPHFPP